MLVQSKRKRKTITALFAVAAAVGGGTARGQSTDSAPPTAATLAQMQAQIQALENRVNSLESNPQQQAAERAATTERVLEEADQHSQLLGQNPLATGYDPNVGLVIRSADGQFSFHPGLTLEMRNMTSVRADIPPKGGGNDEPGKTGYDTQNGFDLTRVRLTFDGHYSRNLSYYMQLQDDQGSTFGLLDAYATLRLSDTSPFYFKFGQFKDPLWHERNLSEASLMAVDRSLVEAFLGGGQASRIQGAALIYNQGPLRGQLVVHDGYASLNTKFVDGGGLGPGVGGAAGVTPTNFGVSNRVEYMVIGGASPALNPLPGVFPRSYPFAEYDGGFSALGDSQDILVVGGGMDYSQAGANDVIFHSADVQYDTAGGLSLYGAYLGTYRDIQDSQGVAAATPGILIPPGHYYDPGAVVQAAYLFTPKLEGFARYDYTYLDGGSVTAFGLKTNKAQELTIGANYYFFKQHIKFTLDGSLLPDGSPTDQDALGILTDSGHREYVIRFQFQLAI